MKTFAYLRVSTDKQDVDNQRHGVQHYIDTNSLTVEWVEDTVSSRTAWRDRGIGSIVDRMSQGDRVIVSEVSRLGRNVLDVLEICKAVEQKDGSIYVVKQSMELIGNAHAKMQLTMMAMFAEFERDMISLRTKEALAKKKAEGIKLGRPEGESDNRKLDEHAKTIKDLLDKNVSLTSICKIVGCSRTTLRKWLEKRGVNK